jgi:hypothetical protein
MAWRFGSAGGTLGSAADGVAIVIGRSDAFAGNG